MSDDLHGLLPTMAPARPGAQASPRGAASLVRVCADDPAAARDWCDALAAEGLRVEAASAAPIDPVAAQAVVLYCTRRLSEHLSSLRELRRADGARALIVVCPELRELDQVLALEMGADDAIDSRTAAAVVAARLRAIWRRGAPVEANAPDHLSFGRLSLHLRERRVQLGAERIDLTECEFEVLWLLAMHAGRAVSRSELLEHVRGLPYQRIDRSIDCRVYRIRAKLRDGGGASQHIRTVRNCGYLFSPARW